MNVYSNYLMIISPPDFIKKEISGYKRASANIIGQYGGMHSIAQITITHQTRCKPFLVQPAIIRFEERFRMLSPVELHISGFNYFNHDHHTKTIYAVIEQTERTGNWFKLLMKQMDIKSKNFVPHITIVKNIPVDDFDKLWPYFEKSIFNASFKAESLTILQRETYAEYVQWKVYRELFFGDRLLAF